MTILNQSASRNGRIRITARRAGALALGHMLVTIAYADAVFPIVTPDDARTHGLESLRTIVESEGVPLPSNLNKWVTDMEAARQLGKAFFHDMAIGSDGIQACVTCHFKAGADTRSKNQMNPDLLRVKNARNGDVEGYWKAPDDSDKWFEIGGPNYQLKRSDFPFVKDVGSGDNVVTSNGTVSPASGNSNDVASSQGIVFHWFDGVDRGALVDRGTAISDDIFNVNDANTRRVEPRNTPTTINAVFNFTNFWDGRANNSFNGENPFGQQDQRARIFKSQGQSVVVETVKMENASLASQAVGPPLSHFEMSFGNGGENFRIMPLIARKVFSRYVLASQYVHPEDSLLGSLTDGKGKIHVTYEELIKRAFKSMYWDSETCISMPNPELYRAKGNQFAVSHGRVESYEPPCDPDAFTVSEANFAFFYGVSVMLYEATLVSDDSPFDQWMRGERTRKFGDKELKGLNVFVNKGKCINCHGGPEMTNASVRNAQNGNNVVEPMVMGDGTAAFYDNGFYNIGVTPTTDDLGRGENDPFGPLPLAFSRQFAFEMLDIAEIPFPIIGSPVRNLHCDPNNRDFDRDPSTCDSGLLGFTDPQHGFFEVCVDVNRDSKCGPGDTLRLKRVAVDGAFKTPGLRNIAETAPYFHNGGVATLAEVVEFYDRGGNFCNTNMDDLDPDIEFRHGLQLLPEEEEALVAFLISLTDERVVKRSAPFDHPEFALPVGHDGSDYEVYGDGLGVAKETPITIAAVGRKGGEPLADFLDIGHDGQFVANPVKGGVCSVTPDTGGGKGRGKKK